MGTPAGPPRRWIARAAAAAAVLVLLVPAGVSAYTYERVDLGPGTVESPASDTTVVSIQGFHFEGYGSKKKPARLVAAGPRGHTEWVYDGSRPLQTWFYDVDPLPNGTLLVTSTVPGNTVVFEFDPETGERVWTRRFDAKDTHDVDLVGDELVVANMRNYDERTGVSHDRVFVYDLAREEIVWEWEVGNHYPASTDGGYREDWTHVNDVDEIGEGRYLVSLRNFDQVVVVDRSTKDIELRLGEDDAHHVLFEQHNPDYLEGANGTPTILVADSENDRVVEYARVNGTWERTWELSGLNWPRDADRLPNGNTLVVDTLNHRVIEVTPRGRVVWEYYATWAPYDAERGRQGSNGPTMREQGVAGSYEVHGGADEGPASRRTFSAWLARTAAGTPVEREGRWLAERYAHVTPWLRPVWMSSWAFASTLLALAVLLGWAAAEAVYQRRRIVDAVRELLAARPRLGG